MSKLVKIKHREYGTVEGVKHRENTCGWEKFENGRLSYFDPEQGWALVPAYEWMTIEVDKAKFMSITRQTTAMHIYGPYGEGDYRCPWRYPSPKKGQAT